MTLLDGMRARLSADLRLAAFVRQRAAQLLVACAKQSPELLRELMAALGVTPERLRAELARRKAAAPTPNEVP